MKMKLSTCLDILAQHRLLKSAALFDEEALCSAVTYDSKAAQAGTLFFCKGVMFKEAYLAEAVARGAVCYISEVEYPAVKAAHIIVSDVRLAMALIGAEFYGHSDRRTDLIGITGTKGKSTSAYYIKYILDEYAERNAKKPCGVVSSIDTYDGKIFEESHLTTPEALMLHQHFYNAAESGLDHFVMEVSSQALKYDRVLGVQYKAGVFLNISEDHISPAEHSDFNDYFTSKLKLFAQSEVAYINTGSDCFEQVAEAAKASRRIVTFGLDEKADVYGYNVRKEDGEIRFNVRCKAFDAPFALTMLGLFNVENALAAIAVCLDRNIPLDVMQEGLRKARSKGRMETYFSENGKKIAVVDYAHNKLSYTKLFAAMREEYPDWRIYSVFGAAGGKAPARRKILTEIAAQFSDKLFLSMDDPGREHVEDICAQMAEHVNGCDYEIVIDRGIAVQRAILEAPENTIILLIGKGNEGSQKIGGKIVDTKTDAYFAQRALAKGFDASQIEPQFEEMPVY